MQFYTTNTLTTHRGEYSLPPLTVCPETETAFETNAATINSLMFNQLRGVAAFAPFFSEVCELLTTPA
jgi:hypothetical protein